MPNSISEFAQDTTRAVSERSSRLGRQAQSTLQDGVERVLRDQPLAVAVAGLAAGAAVAALFPSTEMEGRTLGGAREALTGAAGKAGEMVMDAAEKAKERLQSAAEERGFSSAGLQGLASEVARDLHRCGRRQVRQPAHRSEELGIRSPPPPPPKVATVPTRASRESARNATRLEALTFHGRTMSPDGATDE